MTVKDGGPNDADGVANGKIILNGGPSDDFWGYAVGTLFIRFFGVFLVLGILMIGMIICGKFFEAADKRKAAQKSPADEQPLQSDSSSGKEAEKVAAIALALHLELCGGAGGKATSVPEPEIGPEMAAAIAKAFQLQRS